MSIPKKVQTDDPVNVTEKLGKTIRRLRTAYNYSLGDLSEQSGVAKSIISQIEKNETNPTLGTLYKLARALNFPIEDMLRGEHRDDTPALIEKLGPSGTPLLVSDDGRCRLRIVGWIKCVELVQWYTFEAEPGGTLESEAHPLGSIENFTVLTGNVTIAVGTEQFEIAAGETVRYRADLPHKITNSGDERASAIMVNLLAPISTVGRVVERGVV
jgi:XRE family transcriptional regulator, regulator of sulfur utilization